MAMPSLFLSHGSPMLALEPGAVGAHWRALGDQLQARFGRPKAVLAVSAHTRAARSVLLAAPRHAAVHDFGGFDARLQAMRYEVAGAPELARQAQGLLHAAGQQAALDPQAGGLDHGLWIPLRAMFPAAELPVLPLAWPASASPRQLWRLGEALAPLRREGVLVLASGGITHNLRLFFQQPEAPIDAPEHPASLAFRDWVAAAAAQRDWSALLGWRSQAPHASTMHPTDEHWRPWFLAAGAGGPRFRPQRLFAGVMHGLLGLDSYAFGDDAAALAGAMAGPIPGSIAESIPD